MPRTPAQVAEDCIARSQAMSACAKSQPPGALHDDLLRMALVMAVAALDSYLHALVLSRATAVHRHRLHKKLMGMKLEFRHLVELSRSRLGKKKPFRPWVKVRSVLQDRLLTQTFQSAIQVENALVMAGVTQCWKNVGEEMGETPDAIKRRLDRIGVRRNQIVHEGDHRRMERPQTVVLNDVKIRRTREDLAWMEKLIRAFVAVATKP
jgi:hypothetical protein